MQPTGNIDLDRDARWREWAAVHGYTQDRPRVWVQDHDEFSRLRDHGFVGKHLKSGRYVMFGDPYRGARTDEIVAAISGFGIEVRQYDGLWYPGSTELLELWVTNADLASNLFISTQKCARSGGWYPRDRFIVDHPVRWIKDRP
jgi:hypothetical protein